MVYLFKNRKIGKSENRAIFKEKMQMWTMPKAYISKHNGDLDYPCLHLKKIGWDQFQVMGKMLRKSPIFFTLS